MNPDRSPEKKILSLFIPCATVFLAGFFVMVLEIAASRLIARYLGVSLYTWTSVITVILAGISAGGFLGGWVADLFPPKKCLFVLFLLAALGCAASPVLNRLLNDGLLFLVFSWGLRIIAHVALVFFFPALFLGMISPIVAKDALDRGHSPGRTLGALYAWSAAGSILGTFVTGYFLIAAMGTMAVIWSVAGALAFMSVLFGVSAFKGSSGKSPRALLILLALQLGLFSMVGIGVSRADALHSPVGALYQKDSPYGFINVGESPKGLSGMRSLVIDTLVHSEVFMKDPADIKRQQYAYLRLYADLAGRFLQNKKDPAFLFLGGGGYVMPRYLNKTYPESRIDVVEIDPEVTETAIRYLGLPRKNPFTIHHLDARNYVDDQLRKKQRGERIQEFDMILGDTYNVFSVPYQLTTFEFNEKLRQLLSKQGIYALHLVDFFPSGVFFISARKTLKKTFPYVYSVAADRSSAGDSRSTCLLIASLRPLVMEDLRKAFPERIDLLEDAANPGNSQNSKSVVLTDDYAPIDNMLRPVFATSGKEGLYGKLFNGGSEALTTGRLGEAQKYFEEVLRLKPDHAEAHSALAAVFLAQNKMDEAGREYELAAKKKS